MPCSSANVVLGSHSELGLTALRGDKHTQRLTARHAINAPSGSWKFVSGWHQADGTFAVKQPTT